MLYVITGMAAPIALLKVFDNFYKKTLESISARFNIPFEELDDFSNKMIEKGSCIVCKKFLPKKFSLNQEKVCNSCMSKKDRNRLDFSSPTTCRPNQIKLCGKFGCNTCYKRSFMSNKKFIYWNYSRNNDKKPIQFAKNNNNKFWFRCNKCDHDFQATLGKVNTGRWCSYCTPTSGFKPCEDEKCKHCFNKSFASHSRSAQWDHKKNIKKPSEVAKNNGKKFYFICDVCEHSIYKNLSSVSKGGWCGFCIRTGGKGFVNCGKEGCELCFKHSFLSNEKSEFWDYTKNIKRPENVSKNSHDSFYFKCNECSHSFKKRLKDINLRDGWCKYCSSACEFEPCEDEKCNHCFEKSFASTKEVKYWDYGKNEKKPTEVSKGTNDKKCWFLCNKNHSFQMGPYDVCKGRWCSRCYNCPSCELFRTYGKLCQYCDPVKGNKLLAKMRENSKEYKVVRYLKENLTDEEFIHNKSIGKNECGVKMYRPDVLFERQEMGFRVIVEVDEHKHSGADYSCDEKRMAEITLALEMPVVFIRYNPDSKHSDKEELLTVVKKYLYETSYDEVGFDDHSGLKVEYLFY